MQNEDKIEPGVLGRSICAEPTNNGGTTDYYALPRPSIKTIEKLLDATQNLKYFPDTVRELFPKTLNDLIEFKDMPFWRGEILKAAYGLEGRKSKYTGKTPREVEIREMNKIIYYAQRRLTQLTDDNKFE